MAMAQPKKDYTIFRNQIEVEVTRYRFLGDITVKHTGELDVSGKISEEIKTWVHCNPELKPIVPEPKQKCIVKWPSDWYDIWNNCQLAFGEDWTYCNADEPSPNLDVFIEDYGKYKGKWFRAECVKGYKALPKNQQPDIFKMFLVDIGKLTIIAKEDVYEMTPQLMIYSPVSFRLSLYIEGVNQYSKELDKKWIYLLSAGIRIKVKVFWIYDNVHMAKLISPDPAMFEEHYNSSRVQASIMRWEEEVEKRNTDREAKMNSKNKKRTFHDEWLKVNEKKEKEKQAVPLGNQYLGIGKVHHERVFQLKVPNPIPSEYRDKDKWEVSYH